MMRFLTQKHTGVIRLKPRKQIRAIKIKTGHGSYSVHTEKNGISYVMKNDTGNYLPMGYKTRNQAIKYANKINGSETVKQYEKRIGTDNES